MIGDGQADGLIVGEMARLARELYIQEAVLAMVWDMGGAVFCADTGEVMQDDPDDPMRTAMRQMAVFHAAGAFAGRQAAP